MGLLDTLKGWLRPPPVNGRARAHTVRAALRELRDEDLTRTDWELSVPLTVTRLEPTDNGSDLGQILDEGDTPRCFLDFLTPPALVHVLELAGVIDHVTGLGYRPRAAVELGHPLGDCLRLLDVDFANPLCEIRVRRLRRPVPESLRTIEPPAVVDLLGVEWLSMQHPRGKFSTARPRLPGQEHPGLGLGGRVADLLAVAARRMGADGVLNRPRHYHNAEVYSSRFRYLDPRLEGWLRAVRRDLGGRSLAERSWLIEEGRLRVADSDEVVRFWDGEQVMPTVRRLSAALASRRYRSAVSEAERTNFQVAE
jgi:hypothetical protein